MKTPMGSLAFHVRNLCVVPCLRHLRLHMSMFQEQLHVRQSACPTLNHSLAKYKIRNDKRTSALKKTKA